MALAVIRQRRSHHKKNVSLILNKRWVKDLSSGIVIQGMNDKENRYDTINVNTSERNEKGKPEERTVEEVVIENMQKESTTVAKEPNSLLKELALLREERQRKASQNNNEEKDNTSAPLLQKSNDDDDDDDAIDEKDCSCPICMELFLKPLKLPACGHYICKDCCKKMMKTNKKNTCCPLCREPISPKFDPNDEKNISHKLIKQVKQQFPIEIKALKKYMKQTEKYKLPSLQIEYGNRYAKMKKKHKKDNNIHSWDAYVKFLDENGKRIHDTKFIKQVVFDFSAHVKTIWGKRKFRGKSSKGWFRHGAVGWGTFEFDITIEFNRDIIDLPNLNMTHELVFERNGAKQEVDIDLTAEQAFALNMINEKKLKFHKKHDMNIKKEENNNNNVVYVRPADPQVNMRLI